MNLFRYLLLGILIFFSACGGGSSDSGQSHNGHHVHVAPHGGKLIEVGEHGAGFNLELVLHPDGFLQIYVLDAHAENFVRISSQSIDFEIKDSNNTIKQFTCEAVADPVTGETIGSTSLFTSTERVQKYLPFSASIPKLDILEFSYENLNFDFETPKE